VRFEVTLTKLKQWNDRTGRKNLIFTCLAFCYFSQITRLSYGTLILEVDRTNARPNQDLDPFFFGHAMHNPFSVLFVGPFI